MVPELFSIFIWTSLLAIGQTFIFLLQLLPLEPTCDRKILTLAIWKRIGFWPNVGPTIKRNTKYKLPKLIAGHYVQHWANLLLAQHFSIICWFLFKFNFLSGTWCQSCGFWPNVCACGTGTKHWPNATKKIKFWTTGPEEKEKEN